MKKNLVRIALGLALVLLTLGHSIRLYQHPLLSHLDAITYDTRLRLTQPGGQDSRVVVVDIDEKSLAEVGRWPWSRDKVSRLVRQLTDHYGVQLVGFDVVFAEPDESSGLRVLERMGTTSLKGDAAFLASLASLRVSLDYDGQFAATLKGRPVVLGFYMSNGIPQGALPPAVLPAGTFQGRNILFTSWRGYGGNLPAFQAAAPAGGHFNPLVDFDGISRRVPMLVEHGGQYYESLSLAMVRLLLGNVPVRPGYAEGGSGSGYAGLEWLDLPVPRPCDGCSLLPLIEGTTPQNWRQHVFFEHDFRTVATQKAETALGLSSDRCNYAVVRGRRYKYVHFAGLPPLLFDLENDPHEAENLAGRPEMAATVLACAQTMLDWRLSHADRTLTNMFITKDGLVSRP